MLQRRATAVQPSNLHQLFGVGALAHRGLPPFMGGLCGDHSPHRTTMTHTKRCPIFKFGSWWCLTVHLLVFYGGEHFFREYPVELDLLLLRGILADPCGTSACSASLRAQTRPAIEFDSGEEGLHPESNHIVFPFLVYLFTDTRKYINAPYSWYWR